MMAEKPSADVSRLPNEMLRFILDSSPTLAGPRLGRLLRPGHAPVTTPHYVAATSRGVVPHIAPDMLQAHTEIAAVYMGLEDCKYAYFGSVCY